LMKIFDLVLKRVEMTSRISLFFLDLEKEDNEGRRDIFYEAISRKFFFC